MAAMLPLVCISILLELTRAGPYALNGGPECKNYLQSYWGEKHLVPIGRCHADNTHPRTENEYVTDDPRIYICEDDGYGGKNAQEYLVGANCDMSVKKEKTINLFACNGPEQNQSCTCEIGGDASECSLYIGRWYKFAGDYSSGNSGYFCNSSHYVTYTYIVNMCIQSYSYNDPQWAGGGGFSGDHSTAYLCGNKGYDIPIWGIGTEDSFCDSGSPTAAPTHLPTETPNQYFDHSGCTEEVCAGITGPIAPYGFNGNPPDRPTTTSTRSTTSGGGGLDTSSTEMDEKAIGNHVNFNYHIEAFIYAFLICLYFAL